MRTVIFFLISATPIGIGAAVFGQTAAKYPRYELKATVTPGEHLLRVEGRVTVPEVPTSRESLVYALTTKAVEVDIAMADASQSVVVEREDRPGIHIRQQR